MPITSAVYRTAYHKAQDRLERLSLLKAKQAELDFAKLHGPGNTTCFGVEPLPTVLDQFNYHLQDNPMPISIKVWGDCRETDSVAIRLIQLKKVFEQNPSLILNKLNVYQALEWLKKAFPMIRQDIRPSVLEDTQDDAGNIRYNNTISLCPWDTHEGFDALNIKPLIQMLLKPCSSKPDELLGRNSEKFMVDPKLKESLGQFITQGIEASSQKPLQKPHFGIHIAKCIWHLLPRDTRRTFGQLIQAEQREGSLLVLGTNEQQMDMTVYLSSEYKPEVVLNVQANQNPLRKRLNQKDNLSEPQWIYSKGCC